MEKTFTGDDAVKDTKVFQLNYWKGLQQYEADSMKIELFKYSVSDRNGKIIKGESIEMADENGDSCFLDQDGNRAQTTENGGTIFDPTKQYTYKPGVPRTQFFDITNKVSNPVDPNAPHDDTRTYSDTGLAAFNYSINCKNNSYNFTMSDGKLTVTIAKNTTGKVQTSFGDGFQYTDEQIGANTPMLKTAVDMIKSNTPMVLGFNKDGELQISENTLAEDSSNTLYNRAWMTKFSMDPGAFEDPTNETFYGMQNMLKFKIDRGAYVDPSKPLYSVLV